MRKGKHRMTKRPKVFALKERKYSQKETWIRKGKLMVK